MNTGALIAVLADQLDSTRRLSYRRVVAEWFVVAVVSLVALIALYGLRDDILIRLGEPLFVVELGVNLLLLVLSGVVAIRLCYPDRAHSLAALMVVTGVFVAYSAVMALVVLPAFVAPVAPYLAETHAHGGVCLLCILSFTSFPALWMFWRLRQLASVLPTQAGGVALLSAMAAGCFGVRLVESESVAAGVFSWHYLPLVVFSMAGIWLGRKLFRW